MEPTNRWELFRIAGANRDAFEREKAVLATKLHRGSWECGSIGGEGSLRFAFVADSSLNAVSALNSATVVERDSLGLTSLPQTAFLFPGLGGESFRGFSELLMCSSAFRDIIDRGDRITSHHLGILISDFIKSTAPSPESTVKKGRLLRLKVQSSQHSPSMPTAHALLFSLECALAQTWIEWGVKPAFVAGYSLGEYSAAYVSGVLSFEDGLSLVIGRAKAVDTLEPTGMLAVAGSAEDLARYFDGDVYLVAANSPTQTILGGSLADLANAHQILRAQGYIVQPLAARHAFHTPLMKKASRILEGLIDDVRFRAPQIPWISTLTGKPVRSEEIRNPVYWARHLCEPVNFSQSLNSLHGLGAGIFLEVGPSQSLSALTATHLSSQSSALVVASLPAEYDDRPSEAHILRTAGQLWEAGLPVANPLTTLTITEDRVSSVPSVKSRSVVADDTVYEMRRIWTEVFGHPVQADDNFFDLGGNSLKCAKLAMCIKRRLNIELSLREIFSAPTPRLLGAIISEGHRLQLADPTILVLPNGLSIRCQSHAEAHYFYKSIFEERSYLRHGITISSGMTVFDVGANIGLFSIFAMLEAPKVKLYSFEPVPPVFDILKYNVSDFCDDAEIFNIGLSDADHLSTITYYPNSPGMSSFQASRGEEQAVLEAILRNSYEQGDPAAGEILQDREDFMDFRLQTQNFQCRLKPLNDIFTEFHVEAVDLLKIDVQKLEMQVLRGIAESYWPAIKQVVIEVHDHCSRVQEISSFLSDRRFNITVAQDHLYRGTDIYMLYGAR